MVVELVVELHIDFVQFEPVELEIESVVRNNFEGMNIEQVLELAVEFVVLEPLELHNYCNCSYILPVVEYSVAVRFDS